MATRPKPQLSAEQQKQSDALLADMQTPIDAPADSPVFTGDLRIMRGLGQTVLIGGKEWNLAPFVLKNLQEGYRLIRECNALLVAEAIAGKAGNPVTLEDLTAQYNMLIGRIGRDQDELPFIPAEVYQFLVALPSTMTEEAAQALMKPILLALSRHHPSISAADIEDDFDTGTFVRCLRIIFTENDGLEQSFMKPPAA